ncbi:hypothetical protein D3C84_768630 [compost metagenome]
MLGCIEGTVEDVAGFVFGAGLVFLATILWYWREHLDYAADDHGDTDLCHDPSEWGCPAKAQSAHEEATNNERRPKNHLEKSTIFATCDYRHDTYLCRST